MKLAAPSTRLSLATITGLLRGLWIIFKYQFRRPATYQYPEERAPIAPRNRGRIVLTRDPDGEERCVGCYLCAVVCPDVCITVYREAPRRKTVPAAVD